MSLGFSSPADADIIDHFAVILDRDGLVAALAFLNARTRYRFTGVYRFDPPMLRCIALFDRENPGLRLVGDTPMHETYCSLVGTAPGPFVINDALADSRLAEHPVRASVLAYCGVPLNGDDGRCVGTLCHWDTRPRLAPVSEIALLERCAAVLIHAVVHPSQTA